MARSSEKPQVRGRASQPSGDRPPAAAGRRQSIPRTPAAKRRPPQPPPAPPPDAAEAGTPSWMSGLGGLLRGSSGKLGQISGLDGPARSMERLAQSAERAAEMLERIDREVGVDRLLGALDLLERLTVAAEEIRDAVVTRPGPGRARRPR